LLLGIDDISIGIDGTVIILERKVNGLFEGETVGLLQRILRKSYGQREQGQEC